MREIRQALRERHTDGGEIDTKQIEVIFSPESHLLVEAPAGYGKTRTMVSKIAYLVASKRIGYPKKILALTFSINSAFKIRRDITQQLPYILSTTPRLSQYALQAVYTTNYHGLCRRILGRYGYLIAPELCRTNDLRGVDISKKFEKNLRNWKIELSRDEILKLSQYTSFVKRASDQDGRSQACEYLAQNLREYLHIVAEKFLPKDLIPFDAILLFARQLLNDYPDLRDFYRQFFQMVIVDEFQDTNILQWSLLQDVAGRREEKQNQLFIFGDRHQKIYEFIGAIEGIIDEAKAHYGMREIRLCTNHRFKSNSDLLQFDENMREIARKPRSPHFDSVAEIEVIRSDNQDEEAKRIISQVTGLLSQVPNCTIAILMRSGKGNQNTIRIIDHLNKEEGFSYFFALYSDEDPEYVDFHRKCLSSLYANLPNNRSFRRISNCIIEDMTIENPSETWAALHILLNTFLSHVSREYRFLMVDEKIELVIDTLRNKALKQYLMYVTNAKVTISTIHGSKGLEWDYVILPDMEKNSFPHFLALCKSCGFSRDCRLDLNRVSKESGFVNLFKQELNLFYVGGTRARKKVWFSFSKTGMNASGQPRENNLSCFLNLVGLRINEVR